MTAPLNIKMVQGWSVHLFEQNDPVLKWKVTATQWNEFREAVGRDAETALASLAVKCGMLPGDMVRAFGL